jgi:hypothetical protein
LAALFFLAHISDIRICFSAIQHWGKTEKQDKKPHRKNLADRRAAFAFDKRHNIFFGNGSQNTDKAVSAQL